MDRSRGRWHFAGNYRCKAKNLAAYPAYPFKWQFLFFTVALPLLRKDLGYELPSGLVALEPAKTRSASRLMHVSPVDGRAMAIEDLRFSALPSLLKPGDLLVLNDSKVLSARLVLYKETGGKIEVLLERYLSPTSALAHVRGNKKNACGQLLLWRGEAALRIGLPVGRLREIVLVNGEQTIEEFFACNGGIPLPKYIKRPVRDEDKERYQTIYARFPGSVAAPTAGLHFDEELLKALQNKGVEIEFLTLHIGSGTFSPICCENLDGHKMHEERAEIGGKLCAAVLACRARGGRVIACGTSTVRALETAALGGEIKPFNGETSLFIQPGFRFQVVEMLLTNFHLPYSTLLALVGAFCGLEIIKNVYRHAIESGYLFYSYGDAMLIYCKNKL